MQVGSFRIQIDSLTCLVFRCPCLSKILAPDQFMTWFSFATWSVMADLFISAALLFRSDRVNVLLLIDCTSFLCSSCLTQSFCWVSSTSASDCMRNATVTYLLKSPILQRWGKWKSNPESVPKTGSSQKVNQFFRLIGSIVTPNFNEIGWLLL